VRGAGCQSLTAAFTAQAIPLLSKSTSIRNTIATGRQSAPGRNDFEMRCSCNEDGASRATVKVSCSICFATLREGIDCNHSDNSKDSVCVVLFWKNGRPNSIGIAVDSVMLYRQVQTKTLPLETSDSEPCTSCTAHSHQVRVNKNVLPFHENYKKRLAYEMLRRILPPTTKPHTIIPVS